PALSTVFGGERIVFGAEPEGWPSPLRPSVVASSLPVPLVDVSDPAASFLATTNVGDPGRLLAVLEAAPVVSLEVRLALVRARIDAGDIDAAATELGVIEGTDDADWRITWYRGLATLAAGDVATARDLFDT